MLFHALSLVSLCNRSHAKYNTHIISRHYAIHRQTTYGSGLTKCAFNVNCTVNVHSVWMPTIWINLLPMHIIFIVWTCLKKYLQKFLTLWNLYLLWPSLEKSSFRICGKMVYHERILYQTSCIINGLVIVHKFKPFLTLKIPKFVENVNVSRQCELLVFCDVSMKAYANSNLPAYWKIECLLC